MISRRADAAVIALILVALSLAACRSASAVDPALNPTATAAAERVQLQTMLSTELYPVRGTTTEALFDFIEANGPVDENGERGSGLTSVHWSYEWRGSLNGDTCFISSIAIVADMVITLPRHEQPELLTAVLSERWRVFAESVSEHENVHVNIYRAGAETLKARIGEIGPSPSCDELELTISNIWQAEQTRINAEQETFHVAEEARLEAERAPLQVRIDAGQTRLSQKVAEIEMLDAQRTELGAEIDGLEEELGVIKSEILQIEATYRDGLPAEMRAQLQSLVVQHNDLLLSYGQMIDEYNDSLTRRNQLANDHEALVASTNALVEAFNWTR